MYGLGKEKLALLDELLYRSKNPRQALKTLDKWTKKDPKRPQVQILRARILGECGEYDQTLAICSAIASDESVALDLSLIVEMCNLVYLYQHHNGETSTTVGPAFVKLWQSALKTAKDKEELLLQWYESSVRHEYWDDAQLSTSGLRRHAPNSAKYFYLHVAVSEIAAQALKIIMSPRSAILSGLAFKLLDTSVSKYLEKSDTSGLVSSAENLDFVIQIYLIQGRYQENLTLLDTKLLEELYLPPVVARRFFEAKLLSYRRLEKWPEIVSFCQALNTPETKMPQANQFTGQWDQITAELDAVGNIEEINAEVESMIRKSLHPEDLEKKWSSRISSLGLMAFYERLRKAGNESSGLWNGTRHKEASSAMERHFELYGHENSCFVDMCSFLECLTQEDLQTFREKIAATDTEDPTPRTIHRRINLLKIDFLLLTTSPLSNDSTSRIHLEDIINKAIVVLQKLNNTSSTTMPELYHLIAVLLIRLHSLDDPEKSTSASTSLPSQDLALLHAVALLKHLLTLAQEDRTASLILVRLYSYFGLGSLMLQEYQALRIRGIMNNNFAHVPYTRIAIAHPWPVFPTKAGTKVIPKYSVKIDPLEDMNKALAFFEPAVDELTDLMVNTSKSSLAQNMDEYQKLKSSYQTSYTRKLLVLEQRRVARLTERSKEMWDINSVVGWLERDSDNRNFTAFPNIERSSEPSTESYIYNGPKPKMYWLAHCVLFDDTCSRIIDAHTARPSDTNQAQQTIDQATDLEKSELSSSEADIIKGWMILRRIVLETAFEPNKDNVTAASEAAKQAETFLAHLAEQHRTQRDALSGISNFLPRHNTIQALWLGLEVWKWFTKMVNHIAPSGNSQKKTAKSWATALKLDAIKKILQDLQREISSTAEAYKSMLKQFTTERATQHSEGSYVKNLVETVGVDLIEQCVSQSRESVRDALDGVLKSLS